MVVADQLLRMHTYHLVSWYGFISLGRSLRNMICPHLAMLVIAGHCIWFVLNVSGCSESCSRSAAITSAASRRLGVWKANSFRLRLRIGPDLRFGLVFLPRSFRMPLQAANLPLKIVVITNIVILVDLFVV
jgi:hypothetical protein